MRRSNAALLLKATHMMLCLEVEPLILAFEVSFWEWFLLGGPWEWIVAFPIVIAVVSIVGGASSWIKKNFSRKKG